MFRYIAENITYILIKHNIVDTENREVYCYGLETILLNISLVVFFSLISILLNELIFLLGFILFFIPVRIFAGGFHAEKSSVCFVLSLLLFTLSLQFFKYQPNIHNNILAVLFCLISAILILILAPFKNKNHTLSEQQYKRNKIILSIIMALDFVAFYILISFDLSLASSEMICIFLNALALLAGVVKNKFK